MGCTGDWYHRKGKVTFREANDLLAVLRSWHDKGLKVFGILGNHDIAGHSLDSLDGRAVGSLVHSRVLHLLDHSPMKVEAEDGTVYLTGTSYFHGCDADDDARARMYGADEARVPEGAFHVHLGHGTLLQRGNFFEDYTVAPDLVALLAERQRRPDAIVCGHLHFSEGVRVWNVPGSERPTAVCRVGSLGRVSSDDLERRPHVLLIASRGRDAVFREIPIGAEVKCVQRDVNEPRDGQEHQERIKEFVRVLRDEADQWELSDYDTLIRRIASEMGHDQQTVAFTLAAIERRQ